MKKSSWALISFIASFIGIFILGLFCGTIAVITGVVGLITFDKTLHTNKWQAMIGLILGAIEVLVLGALFFS